MKAMDRLTALAVRISHRYPSIPVSAKLTISYEDGAVSVVPIPIADAQVKQLPSSSSAKDRITAAAPGPAEKPITAKALLKKCGLSWSQYNRELIWQLVDEKRLARMREGYRLTE